MSTRAISAAWIALLMTGVCVGCGSSNSPGGASPQAWVKSVCEAAVSLKSDVQRQAGALSVASVNNLSDVKRGLEAFTSAASADVARAESQIQAAGAPNVSNGKHDETVLLTALHEIADAVNRMESQARALPTDNPTTFQAGALKLSAEFEATMTSASSAENLPNNSTLDQAAESTPACASLRPSS